MGCASEDQQNDPKSFGRVLDEELICRGVFDPIHLNKKKTNIAMSVLRISDLKDCQLSVWRQGGQKEITQEDLESELLRAAKRSNRSVHSIIKAMADQIRSIPVYGVDDSQAFCIIDDTICDPDRRKHPAHANIGFSDRLLEEIGHEQDHEAMKMARRELKELMKKSIIIL